MIINKMPGCRFQDDDNLCLEVEAVSSVITVKAGTFRLNGIGYALRENTDYSVALPIAQATSIFGYLVIDEQSKTSEVHVLVDEVPSDGTEPYGFEAGSGYRSLVQLFQIQVPAKTSDPSRLTCLVFEVKPQPNRNSPWPKPSEFAAFLRARAEETQTKPMSQP